jgi:hypothetical protein
MNPSYLIKGFPGHPLHPPLTEATIGTYALKPPERAAVPLTAEKERAEGG